MATRGGRIKGTSTAGVNVRVQGVSAIHRALAPLLDPELSNTIDVANKRAAQSLAKDVRAEARPVSRHMAKAVRVKRARTGKPGWVVGSRRKVAFFWHMVINGTRAHGPRRAPALVFLPGWNPYLGGSSHGVGGKSGKWVRTRRVRGVKPNPIVDRVVSGREAAAARQIEADVLRGTGL